MRTMNLSRRSPLPADTFLLDTENRSFLVGGSSRIAGGHEMLLVVAVAMIVAGLIGVGLAFRGRAEWLAFLNNSIETRGQVVELDRSPNRRRTSYTATYRYTAVRGGQAIPMTGQATLSRAEFERLSRGAPVRVRYLRDDPANARMNWRPEQPGWIPMAGLGAGLMLFLGVLLLGKKIYDLRALSDTGWLIPGKIINAYTERDDQRNQILHVQFHFIAPDGDAIVGSDVRMRNDLHSAPLPGTPLAVLYVSPELYQVL
ncbi:MAG TPA: DUF3592 domain-containing protein [Roseiflexaceae bacterium]|nr:DUF3592 domain-containing protein [Roseiflexaceae bacterium]